MNRATARSMVCRAMCWALWLACVSVAMAQQPETVAGRGRLAWQVHGCFACHGYGGIGRYNLADSRSGTLVNEQVFIGYLRGRGELNPAVPTQSMPHYPAASLTDSVASDIYHYIKTLTDTPPQVDADPVLNRILEGARGAGAAAR